MLHVLLLTLVAFLSVSCSKDYEDYPDLDSRSAIADNDSTATVTYQIDAEDWKDPVRVGF